MNFYNSLLLISNILILTVQTQSQAAKGPGISACSYYGRAHEDCQGIPEYDVSSIPEACTSIIFNGATVDLNYRVFCDIPPECVALDKTLKAKRPLYIYYGHPSQSEWVQTLTGEACNGGINSLKEMKGLKVFLDEHPGITGLILSDLQNNENSTEFPEFSENLKKYVEVMKTSFPQLEIGMLVPVKFLIDQYTAPVVSWLDIKVIDPVMDFYIFALVKLNECSPEFSNSGIAPITSTSTNYTLETFKSILVQASFPKEKTYIRFGLNPVSINFTDSQNKCGSTIQMICVNSSSTCNFCKESLESYNEKGKFAKENAAGFLTSSIDLNDPANLCKCEKPFPSFYAILDGFNGVTSKPCDLLNKK